MLGKFASVQLRSEYLRLQQVLYANMRNDFLMLWENRRLSHGSLGLLSNDYAYKSFSWQTRICPLPVESRPTSLGI